MLNELLFSFQEEIMFLSQVDFDVLFSGYLDNCKLVPGCFVILRKWQHKEVSLFFSSWYLSILITLVHFVKKNWKSFNFLVFE